MCMCTYVRMYVCVYIYIYIYTHTVYTHYCIIMWTRHGRFDKSQRVACGQKAPRRSAAMLPKIDARRPSFPVASNYK